MSSSSAVVARFVDPMVSDSKVEGLPAAPNVVGASSALDVVARRITQAHQGALAKALRDHEDLLRVHNKVTLDVLSLETTRIVQEQKVADFARLADPSLASKDAMLLATSTAALASAVDILLTQVRRVSSAEMMSASSPSSISTASDRQTAAINAVGVALVSLDASNPERLLVDPTTADATHNTGADGRRCYLNLSSVNSVIRRVSEACGTFSSVLSATADDTRRKAAAASGTATTAEATASVPQATPVVIVRENTLQIETVAASAKGSSGRWPRTSICGDPVAKARAATVHPVQASLIASWKVKEWGFHAVAASDGLIGLTTTKLPPSTTTGSVAADPQDSTSISATTTSSSSPEKTGSPTATEVPPAADSLPATSILYHMLIAIGIDTRYFSGKVPMSTYHTLAARIDAGYRRDVPYHNVIHAADVTQNLYTLLNVTALIRSLTPVELAAAVLAAACHDFGHPGRNNGYLSKIRDPLATAVADRSVLESFHVASLFELLRDEDADVTADFDDTDIEVFRCTVQDMILATDMASHKKNTGEVAEMIVRVEQGQQSFVFDFSSTVARRLALRELLHAADLGAMGKSTAISELWGRRVVAEFFAQGRDEKARGWTPSPMCDEDTTPFAESQIGFLDFVVLPFYASLAKAFDPASNKGEDGSPAPSAGLQFLVDNALTNRHALLKMIAASSKATPDPKVDSALKRPVATKAAGSASRDATTYDVGGV